jgi:hypothetical protein
MRPVHLHHGLIDGGEVLEAEPAIERIWWIVTDQVPQSGQTENGSHSIAAHEILNGCQVEARQLVGVVPLLGV